MLQICFWHNLCSEERGVGHGEFMHRVFVLAEETDLYETIQRNFGENEEIKIRVFQDSLDLLEMISTMIPDLLILDIDILKEQVIKLMHILKSVIQKPQIILVLSQDKMSICSSAFSEGVVSYLVKPVSPDNIWDIICVKLNLQNK